MISRAQRIRLGVFVVATVGILLSLLMAVVGTTLWADRDTYTVRYQISVSGLEIGAPVKYNGVRVGRVERIEIDPEEVSHTIVTISLQVGTPVKNNARAVLNIQGITGLKFIELVGGTSEAVTLASGSEIEAGTSLVDKLTGQAEALSVKMEWAADRLRNFFGEENQALTRDLLERTGGLMNSLDTVVAKNSEQIGQLLQNLATASGRLAAALEEIRRAAAEARGAVAGIRQATEKVVEPDGILDRARAAVEAFQARVGRDEMGKVTGTLHRLLARTDGLVERLDLIVARSREEVRSSLRHLAESAENFRDFSRLIREDPSRLLRQQERRERVLP